MKFRLSLLYKIEKVCQFCGNNFISKTNLFRHLVKYHKNKAIK